MADNYSILVTGLLERDSGKTHFASNLIRLLIQDGLSIAPFKPISGHNFVYHYSNTIKNMRRGALLSMDIQKLARSANWAEFNHENTVPLEVLNPSHVLFTNLLIEPYINERITSTYFSMHTRSLPILQRYSIIKTNQLQKVHHVNALRQNNNEIYSRIALEKSKIELLLKKGDKLIYFSNDEDFKRIIEKYLQLAVESCFKRILNIRPNIILIESVNNAAIPCNSERIFKTVKIVVAVQPGMVLFFDPRRYFKILDEFIHLNGLVGKTLDSVLNIIRPEETFRIPISDTFEKDDRRVKKLLNYLNEFI